MVFTGKDGDFHGLCQFQEGYPFPHSIDYIAFEYDYIEIYGVFSYRTMPLRLDHDVIGPANSYYPNMFLSYNEKKDISLNKQTSVFSVLSCFQGYVYCPFIGQSLCLCARSLTLGTWET